MAFQPPVFHRSFAAALALPVAVGLMMMVNRQEEPPPTIVIAASEPVSRGYWAAWADAVDVMDAAVAVTTAYAEEASVEAPEPAAPTLAVDAQAERTSPTLHTVQTGDTLKDIAAQFGSSVSDLATANSLSDPDFIRVGRVLRIPGAGEVVASAPAQRAAAVAERTPRNAEEAFIFKVAPGAQMSQQETGVPSSVTIAQAIIESFWGRSYLAREANNLFGVKAHSKPGPAGVTWIDAWEVENGQDVTRHEPFRKYNTVAESIQDHGHFFVENSRYRSALQAGDDPKEFARRINIAGYATDPAYSAKLISLMDRYNLYQYDVR